MNSFHLEWIHSILEWFHSTLERIRSRCFWNLISSPILKIRGWLCEFIAEGIISLAFLIKKLLRNYNLVNYYGMISFHSGTKSFHPGMNSFQSRKKNWNNPKMRKTFSCSNTIMFRWVKCLISIFLILEWILESYMIRLEWIPSIVERNHSTMEWNHSRVISQIIINVNNFLIRKAREIIPSAINSHNQPRILRMGLDIKFQKHLERIRSNVEWNHSNMEWIHSKWNEFIPK